MNEQPTMENGLFSTDPAYGKSDKALVAIVGHGTMGKAVERSFAPHVDRFLVDPIYNVTIDQLTEREPSLSFVCTPTSLTDYSDTVDAVLNFASPASPPRYLETPIQTLRTGSQGTDNALQFAQAHGGATQRTALAVRELLNPIKGSAGR